MLQKKFMSLGALAGLSLIGISNCSKSDGASNGAYQGLGSRWAISFTGSNFELTYDQDSDGTDDMTVNGTVETFDNRFQKLTVTSSTGDNAPEEGEEAYGIEVPGFAYFLKPLSEGAEPIVMVESGACPTGPKKMNWIIAKYQEPEATPTADQDAFGTATFNAAMSKLTVAMYEFANGDSLGSSDLPLEECEDGTIVFENGEDEIGGKMYASANGGMLVNPGNGIIFAAPQLAADPTIAETAGTYSGFVFSQGTTPAKVVLNSSGTGSGDGINPETDEVEDDGPVIKLTSVKSGLKGIFRGTVNNGDGNQPLNCVYSDVSGQKLLACNGADGAAVGGVYPSFFFLGVKR